LSAEAGKVFRKYDLPPFVSSDYEGTFPFLDFGNALIENGALMAPSVLAGLLR
jgi:hypothetical protein